MSEHRVSIQWKRGEAPFTYEDYSRDHAWLFEGGTTVTASAAPEYRGSREHVDPEQALVAAVASCHMLTFLAVAARRRITVEHYQDDAIGELARNERGQLAITRIVLRPVIRFAEEASLQLDRAALRSLHERAHRECFIANSVRSEISVDLSAQWAGHEDAPAEPLSTADE